MRQYYELNDEAARLWRNAKGTLTRLRTWDIFGRFLPAGGQVADIGGGPGAHAARLAERGHQLVLVDPLPRHVEQARSAAARAGFSCLLGDARELALRDASVDAVLLLGPLYHLPRTADRQRALSEALRVLRPGGRLLAEVIPRHSWIIDATAHDLLGSPGIWDTFDLNLRTGHGNDLGLVSDGGFWAYFHQPDEVQAEVERAGFCHERAITLTESEPSMLGVSAHLIAVASKPARCPRYPRQLVGRWHSGWLKHCPGAAHGRA
jgi:SAM-dependent methyltransferase